MPKKKMLEEVICYCSKCKLDLNHRITLMDGDTPSKVLCLTCQAEHKYKDPAKTTKGKKATKTKAKAEPKVSKEEQQWRTKLSNSNKTPIKYHINEAFMLEDIVAHPKFGSGLVIEHRHPDKIVVFFDDSIKVLKAQIKEILE